MAFGFSCFLLYMSLASSFKGHRGVIYGGCIEIISSQNGYRYDSFIIVAVDDVRVAAWFNVNRYGFGDGTNGCIRNNPLRQC